MNSDFAHLHVHTAYSLLDGTIRIDDLVEEASKDKMEAVAITDNGNMFGVLDFYSKAKEYGLKPILGAELYVAPQSRRLKDTTSGDEEIAPYQTSRSGLHHLNLLCMNEEGYQNLCKLVSIGYLEGFYYKPRIDKEVLQQYSKGLIATSSCIKGEINHSALMGDMDRAREAARFYRDLFEGRFYLEMQSNGLPQQMMLNQRLQELAEELKIPLLATADCHYLKKSDALSQDVLMAIETGRVLEDTSGANLRSDEFYFKPQAVMKEEFAFCPEAVANTLKIASECNFDFNFTDEQGKKIYHYPKFEPPAGKTQVEHLKDLSLEGLQRRFADLGIDTDEKKKPYFDRLERELKVIFDMGFTGYFLIVADFIGYAKDHQIPVGPGRGSGAGSLVAYSLRITELDPLEHKLLFERFLNPERVSLPDFDVDFCMDKREKVIEYVTEKYGKDCVAQIITFGKLQARGVIRDVGRTFGLLASEVDKIAKLVPETLNITLKDAFEQEPRLRQLTEKDPKLHQLFEICRSLEGLYRHASIHAAGLVISNRPMVEHCPLYRGKNNELVIQFDMNNADRIGLIKFDFLGLKTLTFLDTAEKLVNIRHPNDHFSLNKVPLDDKKVYESLTQGDTFGVFQLESSGMQDLLKRVRPDQFSDIVAITSLYRPGPMVMLDDYIGRKHGQIPIIYEFEDLRQVLSETYGIMVYQEQVQQIAMKLAGYTAGGADLLRRAMGKKKPEEMAKQKAIFIEGSKKNGHDPVKAEKLFDLMAHFAGYGFNKSHAAAYSVVSVQTSYLKTHYEPEFFAGLLSIERENTDKITRYIADAKRHGISILSPDINESETDFTILSDKVIRFGLGAIKGVGQIAIDSVLASRKEKGPFTDLFDLCSRTSNRTVNKKALECFAKAGAFDSFKVNRASLFAAIDDALTLGGSLQKSQDDAQPSFADLLGDDDSTFHKREVTYPNEKPWPMLQQLKYEKDTIGFYLTGHPLDDFQKELEQFTTATILKCQQASSNQEVFLGASISAFREIITKRGDRMAFATLEDLTGQIEAVIFSDVYVESEDVFKCGDPIWIKGQVEKAEGTAKILLSKKNHSRVLPLRHAYEALAREIHVYLPILNQNSTVEAPKVNQLKDFAHRNIDPRGVPLFIHLDFNGRAQTILKMKETVPLKRDTVNFIRNLVEERGRVEFH